MRKRALLASLLVIVAVILLTGCPKSNITKASIAARDFSVSVSAFQDTEIMLHKQGLVSDVEHKQIQTVLLQVGLTGKEIDRTILQIKSQPEAVTALDSALNSTQALLDQGVGNVKNPQAKAELTALVLTMRSFLGIIGTVVKNA